MMYFPASNRVLLQRVVASVMVLAVITACSRPDRTESGSSSDTAAVMQDTLPSAGDTATASVRPTFPRAATASPTRERRDATSQTDSAASGYRAIERDTATAPHESDSARVTEDTSETSLNTSDTTSAGYVEMARDTTTTADQADSAESIRPPQDSTELLGEVNSSETADEEPVNSAEETSAPDRETVAAAEDQTDEVGAAAMGGTVTGGDAVASMTRQGAQCTLVDAESNQAVRWDMSSTPVTLNPCGMGSMNLSKVWTAGSAVEE